MSKYLGGYSGIPYGSIPINGTGGSWDIRQHYMWNFGASPVLTNTYTSPTTSTNRNGQYLEFIAAGAGGGGGSDKGGQGGFIIARFIVPTTTTLQYVVGSAGQPGPVGGGAGGAGASPTIGNGGPGESTYSTPTLYSGGGGGGLTGVFDSPSMPAISQANALIVAGAGGGNHHADAGYGGNGGGSTGAAGAQPGSGGAGQGGSQVAGGAAGVNQPGAPPITATPGTALKGGSGSSLGANGPLWAYGGGGGGAGYYGGGGGGGSSSTSGTNSAGGGGGSGFINATYPFYAGYALYDRNYQGMGSPGGSGVGGPYALGAGKDHPQISPYWNATPAVKYGNSGVPGILIVNEYRFGFPVA